MDWGDIDPTEVERLRRLEPTHPDRLLALIETAFSLRHTSPARAEAIARAQLALARQCDNRHAEAAAETTIVYCAPIEEDGEHILRRLQESYAVLEEVGDLRYLARTADMLSTILESSGDYPAALRYAEVVVEVSRRIGDRLFEGYGISSLTGILTAAGDLDAADKKVRIGLDIARTIDSPGLEARLQLRRGRIYQARGRFEDSLRSFRRAQELSRETRSLFTEVYALTELGGIFETLGQLGEAEATYNEAIRLADEDVRRVVGPRTRLGLGRLYLKLGRVEEARDILLELIQLARGFDMVPVECEASKVLVDAFKQLGDTDRALKALERHLELREMMTEGKTQRAVKKYQVRMELEAAKKDAEIYRLKYVELEAMQTQLVEAERMAVVGNLASGLAHEMNTPLGVVRSNLDTSDRAMERVRAALPTAESKGVENALAAFSASHRTAYSALLRLEALVLSLRRFTRLDEADYQRLDLVEGLEATLQVFRPSVPSGIEIRRDLRPVRPILGWPGALNQAFLTLLMNAVDAVKPSGTIEVSTTMGHEEARVMVADNGPGIPADVQPRLFELELLNSGPRTRFRVGLATVRAVVLRHRGRISYETGPEQGTTFTMRFPLASDPRA